MNLAAWLWWPQLSWLWWNPLGFFAALITALALSPGAGWTARPDWPPRQTRQLLAMSAVILTVCLLLEYTR